MSALILAVEDTPHNLDLMIYLLESSGHRVVSATNGADGLEVAHRTNPDLIVLDVQLPDMDGYQVLANLRADDALARTPVIAVTAFAMVGDRDHALAAGFDGYLSKPIDPTSFISSVESFLPPELHGKPAVPTWVESSESVTHSAVEADQRGRRVLIGQISDVSLAVLRSALEPHGYALDVVATVGEMNIAIERARPGLLVAELDPARGYGYNFIKQATEVASSMAINVALVVAWDNRRALPSSDVEVIRSPIDPESLLAQLDAMFQNRSEV